jgi:hypothetical protein
VVPNGDGMLNSPLFCIIIIIRGNDICDPKVPLFTIGTTFPRLIDHELAGR